MTRQLISPLDRVRRTGDAGRRSERLTAKRLGAKVTPASGAASAKGDMSRDDFLIEAKSTVANTMQLELHWLLKIEQEARATGRKPAIAITFTHGSGKPVRDGRWIAIPEELFAELIGSWE